MPETHVAFNSKAEDIDPGKLYQCLDTCSLALNSKADPGKLYQCLNACSLALNSKAEVADQGKDIDPGKLYQCLTNSKTQVADQGKLLQCCSFELNWETEDVDQGKLLQCLTACGLGLNPETEDEEDENGELSYFWHCM